MLKELKAEGYTLVGLEQATNSVSLHDYRFPRRTALVLGNERLGLTDEELKLVDVVVEIPVWGLPYAYNVATCGDGDVRVLPAVAEWVTRMLRCDESLSWIRSLPERCHLYSQMRTCRA